MNRLASRGIVLLVALVSSLCGPLSLRPALADGAWLDQSPPAAWSAPGASVPPAPAGAGAVPVDPRCTEQNRPPETPADRLVAGAGWTVYGSYLAGWNVQVVRGLAGYDGMCRPLQYQEFVFVDGAFAGTISPTPMDSRADGAGDVDGLTSTESGAQLTATFRRYSPEDPLCCPSATSSVTYGVDRASAPRIVPAAVSTTPSTPPPGAIPPAPPPPPAPIACLGQVAGAERVALCFPSGIGTGVQGRAVPRSPQPGPSALEGHRLLVVQGYPVPVPGAAPPNPPVLSPQLPQIAIFSLGDFDQPGAYGASQVQALRQLLDTRPAFSGLQAFPQGTVSLPRFVGGDLGSPFTAKPAYLDLPWGTGVRGVVQAGQAVTAPQNGRLQYQFAGLSADNRWLVVATFPLAVPALPPVPAAALGANPQEALVPVQVYLSLLDESLYAPSLAALDAVLQSLQIGA
jgi:hypothetical protein